MLGVNMPTMGKPQNPLLLVVVALVLHQPQRRMGRRVKPLLMLVVLVLVVVEKLLRKGLSATHKHRHNPLNPLVNPVLVLVQMTQKSPLLLPLPPRPRLLV